ncbi:SDR family oxidoreductase [Thalassolituus sp.]|jgi:3-oxoacyl-[acyl-carrier protein] reductase|uniref:SDR family oxidoreductase n=1 Tax=Thalassolituus sp. TaxID=2030822 RepID=UPI002603B1DB|nr:SDR family oxidoreductase [uncultured Thalassolituus sp.]
MNLKQKTIAVTGAGQGLGRSMAVELARKGANIAVIDLNEEAMHETQRQVNALGSEARCYVCNVADEESVETTFNAIAADFGGLHGLVNNAGVLRDALMVKAKGDEITKMSLAQWQTVIDVNLTGVFLCGREAAVHMIRGKEPGSIINISSISRAGNMGQTNYSAAKAGVAAMAVTWAKELARYNIRANAIAPGFISTEMTSGMRPETLEMICSGIPASRMGTPEEIAHAVIFLMENEYVSGRIVEVDGALRI